MVKLIIKEADRGKVALQVHAWFHLAYTHAWNCRRP